MAPLRKRWEEAETEAVELISKRNENQTKIAKKEAESLEIQMMASIENGGFAEPSATKLTVSEYLTRWLETNAQSVRKTTQRRYSDLMKQHVIPIIGKVQLAKLAPLDIQRLYTDRLDSNEGKLSPTNV
jgi:integrase